MNKTILLIYAASIMAMLWTGYSTYAADRSLATEAAILAKLEEYNQAKAAFTNQVDTVLANISEPMLSAADNLVALSESIYSDTEAYALAAGLDPNETATILGLFAAKCDPNSIADRKQALVLLKAVIEIAADGYSSEPAE